MWKKAVFSLTLILAVSLCFINLNYAATTGKISGRIIDAESGEPLPGANVVIEGTTQGGATDTDGYYFIINVRPSVYTLKATMMGYQTLTKTGVAVAIDRTTTVDFQLKQTVISGQEVTVVAERNIVPLDVANSQQIVQPEEIEKNNYTNIADIMTSQVGITTNRRRDRPSIRGAAYSEASFLVDGLSVVDEIQDAPVYKLPLGAIQEVNVITGGFNAEYGNVRSGVINVVTKEGGSKYSGSINFKYSPPSLKNFGPNAFGAQSPIVKPFTDPASGAWTGNNFFDGWYKYSGVEVDENGNPLKDANGNYVLGENGSVKPGAPHYGKPYENLALYLWRHRSMDNLNMLRDLVKKGLVNADLGKVTDKDAVFETGDTPDYLGEFTFGGPMPFLNKMKFFAAYSHQREEYSVPTPNEAYMDHNASLKLTYPLSESMKLAASFTYSYLNGFDRAESSQGPNEGGFITSNPFVGGLGNKSWYPHCMVAGIQNRYYGGLKFTHVLSPATFYEVNFTSNLVDYGIDQYIRNTQPIPGSPWHLNYLDQGRIGTTAQANEWAQSSDPKYYGYEHWKDWAKIRIGDYWYDESPWGYGPTQFRDLTGYFRMSSCNVRIDNSMARNYTLKFDITSQMNRFNLVKAGFNISHDLIGMHYDAIDPSVNGGSQRSAYAKPWKASAYIQDKLEFQGMIANVGVRMDYLRTGRMVDFNSDVTDKIQGPYSIYMESGYRQNLYDMNWTERNKIRISPRLGISHPISADSKLFFNYGHFYKWADMWDTYVIRRDTRHGDRIDRVGNADANPPLTIQYEIGYAASLFNLARVQITGYYRDISDELRDSRFRYIDGFEYRTYTNNRYRDNRGFELNVDFPGISFVSGWINYNYMITSSGEYGFYRFYEDPNKIPSRRSTGVSQAAVRPITKANIAFHSPEKFGPAVAGYAPLSDIDVSFLYWHKAGMRFTWNPDNIPYVVDNKQWKADWMLDMRFTKRLFKWHNIEPIFFIDVHNLFNHKHLPHPSDGDYANRRVWNAFTWFKDEFNKYMFSLKPGDQPGEVQSKDKPYIVMPGFSPWWYYDKRDIYYGIKLNFTL